MNPATEQFCGGVLYILWGLRLSALPQSLNSRVIVELLGVFVKQPSSDNTSYEKIDDEV